MNDWIPVTILSLPFVVLSVALTWHALHKAGWLTAHGRAARRQQSEDSRRMAQYVRLGMTPDSAERLVADERARESAAVAMIVRDTETAR